jgi:hypothetical protein
MAGFRGIWFITRTCGQTLGDTSRFFGGDCGWVPRLEEALVFFVYPEEAMYQIRCSLGEWSGWCVYSQQFPADCPHPPWHVEVVYGSRRTVS